MGPIFFSIDATKLSWLLKYHEVKSKMFTDDTQFRFMSNAKDTMATTNRLTLSAPSANYCYCSQTAMPLLSRDNKSEILGHLCECTGKRSVVDVKQPQAVLPKKISL